MTTTTRTITRDEQEKLGLIRRSTAASFVQPSTPAYPIVPSRHEVIDPYAEHAPQPVQHITHHHYTPINRAQAVLLKTSAITVFMAILTACAMFMLDSWFFLLWLALGSLEWVFCFCVVAVLDWRETPSALTWKQSSDYMELMRTEQAARLRAIYNYEVE